MPHEKRSSSHTATPVPTPLDPSRSRAAQFVAGTRRGTRMQELRMILGAGTTLRVQPAASHTSVK